MAADLLENEVGLRVIPASEILDKIRKGEPVDYDHVIIQGDLDVSNLNLPKENDIFLVTSSISIDYSQIEGKVVFTNTIFDQAISFVFTEFNGRADLRSGFQGTIFRDRASFTYAKFKGDYYDFSEAAFGNSAVFNGVMFNGIADFANATFNGYAGFLEASFNDKAYFSEAQFSERNKTADFNLATFRGNAYFNHATFKGNAHFLGSRFDQAYFEGAAFYGILLLEESKFYLMDLSDAIFENGSTISLKLSNFFRLQVRWEAIRDKMEYDGSAYLTLVKNFNNLELFDDADECYYQYRTKRRKRYLKRKMHKLLDYVAWIAYGYGVRPRNPLILSLGLFLISILVFASGFRIQELQEPLGSIINATYLSVFVFTSSPKTDPLTGFYEIWGTIERIAGWLLMACFLVVLAKKTLR